MSQLIIEKNMREKIAEIIRSDLSQQIKSAGFDDPAWVRDICDNTATTILNTLFHKNFRYINDIWAVRYVGNWNKVQNNDGG